MAPNGSPGTLNKSLAIASDGSSTIKKLPFSRPPKATSTMTIGNYIPVSQELLGMKTHLVELHEVDIMGNIFLIPDFLEAKLYTRRMQLQLDIRIESEVAVCRSSQLQKSLHPKHLCSHAVTAAEVLVQQSTYLSVKIAAEEVAAWEILSQDGVCTHFTLLQQSREDVHHLQSQGQSH
jgi:hypothetical protein